MMKTIRRGVKAKKKVAKDKLKTGKQDKKKLAKAKKKVAERQENEKAA